MLERTLTMNETFEEKKHISELNSDVKALHNLKRNQNATIDFDLISSHMINVSRVLHLISSQIKNNNYGNKI